MSMFSTSLLLFKKLSRELHVPLSMLRFRFPECLRAIYKEMNANQTAADAALATGNGLAIVLGGISAALVSICITAFCIWVWGGSSNSREEAVRDDQTENANTLIGLSGKAIETIPKVSYKTLSEMRDEENPQELCCPICLSEFQESDDGIRLIPGCNHSFHIDCIRKWLSAHASCPVCRVKIKDPFNGEP